VRPAPRSVLDRSELWLTSHVAAAAAVVVLCSVAVVLFHALGSYLNPDEAFLFTTANADSFVAAYSKSRSHPHPPLYVLLLHATLAMGTEEAILRLPSIVAAGLSLPSAGCTALPAPPPGWPV
jgi:hypothetical protein